MNQDLDKLQEFVLLYQEQANKAFEHFVKTIIISLTVIS